jgi:hypothetical protein
MKNELAVDRGRCGANIGNMIPKPIQDFGLIIAISKENHPWSDKTLPLKLRGSYPPVRSGIKNETGSIILGRFRHSLSRHPPPPQVGDQFQMSGSSRIPVDPQINLCHLSIAR